MKIPRALLVVVVTLITVFVASGNAWAETDVFGSIAEDTLWSSSGSPYVLTADVVVASDATLTIDPGVEVHGAATFELAIDGTLNAVGTAEDPVVFRSVSGSGSQQWDGLSFSAGASAVLRNASISNTTTGLTITTPDSADFDIANIQIDTFGGYAIQLSGGGLVGMTEITILGAVMGTGVGILQSGTNLDISNSWLTDLGTGIWSVSSHTSAYGTVFARSTNGIDFDADAHGTTWALDVDHCTFYGNDDAVDVRRGSSNRYAILTIDRSLFGNNTVAVRDSYSSYPTSFSRFVENLWWGGTQFVNTASPSANSGNLRYNGLLADPDADNFAPSDRSPARWLNPADPDLTIGAVPYDGDQTGDGVHGYWYVDHTFAADSVTEVAGDMVVAPGATVTFLPGSEFQAATTDFMDGGDNNSLVELRVEGTLEADGTLSKPVFFTSAAESPDRGDWYGIVIEPDTEAFNVSQVDVGYALRGVTLENNDHIVAGSRIHNCSEAGIYISGGTPSVEQMELFDNFRGIYVLDGADVAISSTDIHDNSEAGLVVLSAHVDYDVGAIYDNGGDGIDIDASTHGTTWTAELTNLTGAHKGGDGIDFRRSSSNRYQTGLLDSSSVTHNSSLGVRDGY